MPKELAPSKLNALLMRWRKGTVAVQSWLDKEGIPRQLADQYCRSQWLERIGRGAYKRKGDTVDVLGAVYTLQFLLNLPVHVGARTALEMHAVRHFVSARPLALVHLYGRPGRPLPAWFRGRDWGSKVRFHLVQLFPGKPDLGVAKRLYGERWARFSTQERAGLELADLVPKEQSFSEARLLMESLTTLRPELVQELLEACRSFKAKRLFLYLAEEANHPWFKELDLSKVDLGKGKLSLIKGGRFDSKYQMTVEADSQAFRAGEGP